MRLKHLDFLWDVLLLACTSFGGPQVHFALFLDRLVKKRDYLTEEELFEIQALCSVLPGPTTTQMIKSNPSHLILYMYHPSSIILYMLCYVVCYVRNAENG